MAQVFSQAAAAPAVARSQSGRAVVEWDSAMSAPAEAERAAEEIVRKAVSGGRLAVRFQPVVNVESERVVCIEALARL